MNRMFALLCSFLVILSQAEETFVVPYQCPHATTPLDPAARQAIYPYISGDAFRQACDFIIDETKIPFNPDHVQTGSTIFVNADCLEYFFAVIHPKIQAQYILVTHNSDNGVPGQFISFLDDERLAAWFGQNITNSHQKIFPIPIGISNKHWFNGDPKILERLIKQPRSKRHLLYMNFVATTNYTERTRVQEYFRAKTFCYNSSYQPYERYLEDIAESYFVLSPEGNGIDCVRTWEALLLGSIAVVKHSSIDALFQDLPVLLIDDWPQITEEYLNQAYEQMKQRTYNLEKIYAPYWINQIHALQATLQREHA